MDFGHHGVRELGLEQRVGVGERRIESLCGLSIGDAPRADGFVEVINGVDRPNVNEPPCLTTARALGRAWLDHASGDGIRVVAKSWKRLSDQS